MRVGPAREELNGALRGSLITGVSTGVGVLVLGGSSGHVEAERAELIARQGAIALALGWFGGAGQSRSIAEVPLELFSEGLDVLASRGATRLVIVGVSKGAEAGLLTASRDERVHTVVAISPSAFSWAEVASGPEPLVRPLRSSWSLAGRPVPFVPYDDTWAPPPPGQPLALRGLYESSLHRFEAEAETAAIPVERAAARIVVVAGLDDQVWPSLLFAEIIGDRRRRHGRDVEMIGLGPLQSRTRAHFGEGAGPSSHADDDTPSELVSSGLPSGSALV